MSLPIIITQPPPPPPDDDDDNRRVPPELTVTVNYNPAGGLSGVDEARARRIIDRRTAEFLRNLEHRLQNLED